MTELSKDSCPECGDKMTRKLVLKAKSGRMSNVYRLTCSCGFETSSYSKDKEEMKEFREQDFINKNKTKNNSSKYDLFE